jgi:hypothetical protein
MGSLNNVATWVKVLITSVCLIIAPLPQGMRVKEFKNVKPKTRIIKKRVSYCGLLDCGTV